MNMRVVFPEWRKTLRQLGNVIPINSLTNERPIGHSFISSSELHCYKFASESYIPHCRFCFPRNESGKYLGIDPTETISKKQEMMPGVIAKIGGEGYDSGAQKSS